MLPLFGVAIFTNAALLFLVQPMIARLVLPRFGGAPAVWTTCMLFFQLLLLAGYLYSHLLTTRLGRRRQIAIHVAVMALPLAVLPLGLPHSGWLPASWPATLSLLALLGASAGLPYFAVATSGAILQKWFAGTDHAKARDPYFLYAASSFGNMLGLLAYPLALEPWLRLPQQSGLWTACYAALVGLVALCALLGWRSRRTTAAEAAAPAPRPVTWRQRTWWIALAFVPSSLMLGVTTYLTTDIAAAPFLWLPPLALYLLSFIIAFSRAGARVRIFLRRSAPYIALTVFFLLLFRGALPTWGLAAAHLAAFLFLATAAHGELARRRPIADHLTEFYLWISVGGAAGGLLNAVVAPLCFASLVEYPLTLLAAAFLLVGKNGPAARRRTGGLDYALAAFLLALTCWFVRADWLSESFPLLIPALVPSLLLAVFRHKPAPLRAILAGLLVLAVTDAFSRSAPLYRERSFFGVVTVTEDKAKAERELRHGTTIHGRQSIHPKKKESPLTYYFPGSPIADVLDMVRAEAPHPNLAVLGMGTGTIAAYGRPGDHLTFYEIDPTVEKLSRDARFFTYITDAEKRGARVSVVLGDARLTMERAASATYDLIVADAFSSDSVPVHLLTEEAARLYVSKLKPNGVLLFHISNRYLGLEPVIAHLARTLGWTGARGVGYTDETGGAFSSEWIVLTRDLERLVGLTRKEAWRPVNVLPRLVWRDDYSNVVSALRWLQSIPEED